MDVGEEVVQPLADVDLCQFAASHEGVDDGSILGCIVVSAEEIVLASKTSGLTLFSIKLSKCWYNIAERNIRPLTVERKNSLFFGNHAKAEMLALYHTFIATCQMMGLSVLKYFKNLFAAIAAGRTDYENMLPMTICLRNAA